jgi:hypothetical protein
VLLRECQRGGRRVHVDASREFAFADQLQPDEPVPVAFLQEFKFYTSFGG